MPAGCITWVFYNWSNSIICCASQLFQISNQHHCIHHPIYYQMDQTPSLYPHYWWNALICAYYLSISWPALLDSREIIEDCQLRMVQVQDHICVVEAVWRKVDICHQPQYCLTPAISWESHIAASVHYGCNPINQSCSIFLGTLPFWRYRHNIMEWSYRLPLTGKRNHRLTFPRFCWNFYY